MNFLRRWLRKSHKPSLATIEAKQRLDDVCKDDARVDKTVARQEKMLRENHLGPAIAQALRGHRQ